MSEPTYAPAVGRLLTLGEIEPFAAWRDYRGLGIGPEHAPDLARLATDLSLAAEEPDTEAPEIWVPIHAWRALGQLGAEEAIAPLIGLFAPLDDNEWATEELPPVLGMIGPAAIPAFAAYAANPENGMFRASPRSPASRRARNRTRQLAANEEPCTDAEAEVNAFCTSDLIRLKATESLPAIDHAHERGRVELSPVGCRRLG